MVILDCGDDAPEQAIASVSRSNCGRGGGAVVWLLGVRDEFEEKEKVLLHAHLSSSNQSDIMVSRSTSEY